MAEEREIPYGQFNFIVEWDGLDGHASRAGFTEVTGLDASVSTVEYRAGNSKANSPIKVSGLTHYADVHLKRGLLGSLDLYEWFNEVSRGRGIENYRMVSISLLDESKTNVVYRWLLTNARPVALKGPKLDASNCAVAIEELVLAHEGLRIE